MGFLGSLSNYITPAVQAAGGIESGKLQGVIEKIKADKDARAARLQDATMRHLNAESNHLENPDAKTPQFHFDQDGNAYTLGPDGHLKPATIDAAPTSVSPPAQSTGDIDLGAPQQGTQAPKAPVTSAPKFGPRQPPDPVAVHKKERDYDVDHPLPAPPTQPQIISASTPNADGSPGQTRFFRVPKAGGDAQEIGGIVPTPKAGTGAQGNAEQVKKAEQFGLGLSSLGDVISGMEKRQFKAPNMVTGPMTAEARTRGTLGEMAQGGLNLLDPGLAELSGSQNLFMSAAAHSVGGARITPEQIAMFTSGYTARTNDSPELVKQKLVRSVDFLNAAMAVLPPDMAQKQLAALSPETMALLKRYGFGKAPSPQAQGAVAQIQEATGGGASTGDVNLGAKQLAPLTQVQRVRAAKDSKYREFKESQGYKF